MAKIVHTATSSPQDFTKWEHDQVYNGLDCVITREVLDATLPQLDATTRSTYEFSKALQGPALEMALRGVLVDQQRKAEVIDLFYDKIDQLERQLERIVLEGVGLPHFNWRSNADLQTLFYDRLGIPVIRKQGRPTVDRGALEKMEAYTIARPIISHMSAMRELAKKISVLKTEVDRDGRIRTSYNIAGTDTGRFSSSFSAFGTGGNLQNVEESLRSIFISDAGYKFAKCDAKSGESFVVGAIEWNLFNDPRYIEACESGDPHTAVARICWPSLPWTGDLKRDKSLAETPYYRHYTHRFMCKKLGHGSNYGGKPATLAAQSKLPLEVVSAFQPTYFAAFPAHQAWQAWVATQVATKGHLISLGGRKRWFMGRRTDPDTIRAAIAYDPQETLARVVNQAMLHIWRQNYVTISMHDHDALTFMYPQEMEDEIIPRIMQDLIVRIPLANGRELAIPYDCKVGWNKGEYDARVTPKGLKTTTAKTNGHAKRRLGSWIESFVEHTDNLESPTLFRKWAGIFTVAAAMEMKCYLRTSSELYPNLYIFIVGHPGVGKNRIIRVAKRYMAELPEFHFAPTSLTGAALVDTLAASKRFIARLPDPPIEYNNTVITAEELTAFMHKYDDEMVGLLSAFYDPDPYAQSRRGHEIRIKIDHPQVNLISGTTPSNLIQLMPESAWDQGFTSRVILVHSDERIVGDDFAHTARDLDEGLINDIKMIGALSGEFKVTQEYRSAVNAWRECGEPPVVNHPEASPLQDAKTCSSLQAQYGLGRGSK